MDTTGRLAGAVGKLDGIALRLSQTLEFLEWAWSISNGEEPTQVSLRSLMNSIRIIDEWVKPNLARVFSEAALPVPQRDAITVGAWLQRTTALPAPGAKPNIVNARELRRAPGFTGPKDAKELDAALEFLVDARWLIPIVSQTGGRPKKDYAIDSRIYDQPIRTESDQ
jgi:hypothetical protein